MDLKKLMEVGMVANKRVTDSEIRKQRILDAKRKMAEKRGEKTTDEKTTDEKLDRIGDSARPTRTPMRGVAQRRAVATQARMQDSRAKSYFALRKRIKDELEETESTEDAIEAAQNIMEEEVDVNPKDVLAAVVEVLGDVMDTLPEGEGEVAEEGDADDYADEYEDEVSDSLRKRQVIRRNTVADANKRVALRKRSAVADSRKRAELRKRVLDALARKRAAQKRIRDARERRADVTRKAVADNQVASKRLVRRG